jgi:hypothetical protein
MPRWLVIAFQVAAAVAALILLRYLNRWIEPLNDEYLRWAVQGAAIALLTALVAVLIAATSASNTAEELFLGVARLAGLAFCGCVIYFSGRLGWEVYWAGGIVGEIPYWLIGAGLLPVAIAMIGAFAYIAEEREGRSGTPPLLTLLIAGAATVVLVMLATQVTYTACIEFDLYNPFGRPFSYYQLWLFYCDETLKGALFDFSEVFKIHIQDQLSFDARAHWSFGLFVVVYRMCASFIVVGALVAMWKNW